MIRVTLVAYDNEPPLGGQGAVVAGMRRTLARRGVAVTTVSGRGSNAVRVPRLTGRAPLDLSIHLNRHPHLLAAGEPDLIHAHGGPGGVLLLRSPAVPLVYTAHHTYRQAHPSPSLQRLLSPLEARAYRRAEMVLPVSASTAEAVRAIGVPAQRIEVVPPGIDPPEEDDRRREPGRLLFVGRWEPNKGVLDAVAVMAELTTARPDVTAAVVGSGSLGPMVTAAVRDRVARIEVLGALDADQLAAQYARAAIVIMPSRYEGLGLVALEAMAAGAVVVGYDVDGLRGVVADSDAGILVPMGDIVALRRGCESLLEGSRRLDLASRGRAHVVARHSWAATARRLEEIYRHLLELR